MKLQVFTLQYDESAGRFDDAELRAFFDDPDHPRDVQDVSDHFFIHGPRPVLALLVTYHDMRGANATRSHGTRRDWRAELDESARQVYDKLRKWRGRAAKREGLPPYLIVTNQHMAELAVRRPASLSELRDIHGIGDAKAKRWGEEILSLLTAATTAEAPPPGEDGDA